MIDAFELAMATRKLAPLLSDDSNYLGIYKKTAGEVLELLKPVGPGSLFAYLVEVKGYVDDVAWSITEAYLDGGLANIHTVAWPGVLGEQEITSDILEWVRTKKDLT